MAAQQRQQQHAALLSSSRPYRHHLEALADLTLRTYRWYVL